MYIVAIGIIGDAVMIKKTFDMCKVNCLHCFLFCLVFFLYLLYDAVAKAYATHTISHPGGGSGVSSGRGNGNLIMTRACLLGFICALLCASTQRSRCD